MTFYSRSPTAISAAITSINGNTTSAQTIAAGAGISVSSASGTTTVASTSIVPNAIVNVSSDVTLTNKAIHFVDTSSARSLTLPAPSSSLYIILKDSTGGAASNNVMLVRPGAQKIDTVAASYVFNTTLFSSTIVSDGTDYFLL